MKERILFMSGIQESILCHNFIQQNLKLLPDEANASQVGTWDGKRNGGDNAKDERVAGMIPTKVNLRSSLAMIKIMHLGKSNKEKTSQRCVTKTNANAPRPMTGSQSGWNILFEASVINLAPESTNSPQKTRSSSTNLSYTAAKRLPSQQARFLIWGRARSLVSKPLSQTLTIETTKGCSIEASSWQRPQLVNKCPSLPKEKF